MNDSKLTDEMTPQTWKTTKGLAKWTGLWLVSLALFTFGPMFLWDYNAVLSSIALIVNLFMGFKMIMANKVHLEGLDEMQQRIMLEAMAISLGTTMIVGAAFGVMEAVKLVSFQPNASLLLFVMGISYGVGTLISRRRFL